MIASPRMVALAFVLFCIGYAAIVGGIVLATRVAASLAAKRRRRQIEAEWTQRGIISTKSPSAGSSAPTDPARSTN
ncbi:hypothetical protein [Rhizobium tumorigenes]|uniref:hypothetical protein n=1 Tax=Rhizobium tumorigenes TaxID=2041385 RepID=UPI00241F0E0F|nr:hypothetical protein [Rhizobium tumorigenes]WFS02184.1 hypothetical protein PR016_06110 [Rhizobium tumorigenes]